MENTNDDDSFDQISDKIVEDDDENHEDVHIKVMNSISIRWSNTIRHKSNIKAVRYKNKTYYFLSNFNIYFF